MRETFLVTVKGKREEFVWGRPIEMTEVGPYSILFYEEIFNGEVGPRRFHIWVNGVDCNRSTYTLDAALAAAIAYRHEGPNHHADAYFIRSMQEEA